jgi:hypothetical protein
MTPDLLLTAVLLGASAASGGPAATVASTGDAGCSGVTVVVVPAGQEAEASCAPARPGRTAAELFEAAGHELTRVQRFPGAVCRVAGVPADDPCVAMPPADAYWGFFHASAGEWSYATLGVDAVVPEAGEAVAMAWQDTATPEPPAVDPAAVGSGAEPASEPEPDDGTTGSSADDTDTPAGQGIPLPAALAVVAGLVGVALLVTRRRRS